MQFRYMGIIVILSMLSMLSYLLVAGRYYLHMFQLSGYYQGRFYKWQKSNISALNIISALIAAICAVMCRFNKFFAIGVVLLSVIRIIFHKAPPQKKKMVYTDRVKRQITVFAVIYAFCFVLVGVSFILEVYRKVFFLFPVCYGILSLFSFIPCVWISASALLNLPIEKRVQKYYIDDAKKKLDAVPNLKVIGITGSYGKTSSKYMLNAVLSEKFNTLMTPESYNTIMGVVKTIRGYLSPLHQVFICEMGAKHVGEIKEIAELVKPDTAMITTIGIQHLESFGSEENIIKAKFELVDVLSDDGTAFLNYDCAKIKDNNRHKNTVSFGFSEGCDYRATNIVCSDRGTSFTLNTKDGKEIKLSTKLLGRHNVINLVAAAAIGLEMGVSEAELIRAAAKLSPVPHRLELKQNGAYSVIDNAFNSNPEGAKESLHVLSCFEGYTKIAVTPGFIELGAKQEEESEKFGHELAKTCDAIILVGKAITEKIKEGIDAEGYSKPLFIADTLNEALTFIPQIIGDKKVVLFENDLPDDYEKQK